VSVWVIGESFHEALDASPMDDLGEATQSNLDPGGPLPQLRLEAVEACGGQLGDWPSEFEFAAFTRGAEALRRSAPRS